MSSSNVISIVIPWRDSGCPHRARAHAFVRSHLDREFHDVEIMESDGDRWGFSRAAAINRGVAKARGDVIVVHDADSTVATAAIQEAVRLATEVPGTVSAFDSRMMMTLKETDAWLSGTPMPTLEASPFPLSHPLGGGGVSAFSRETFDRVGGYDERFQHWGFEDTAFSLACHTLAGPLRRVPGTLVHLWHPPQGSSVNHARARRYDLAIGDVAAMRALVAAISVPRETLIQLLDELAFSRQQLTRGALEAAGELRQLLQEAA